MEREQSEFRCFCNVQITKYLSQNSMQTFQNSEEADQVIETIFQYWLRLLSKGMPKCQTWDDEMLYFYQFEIPFKGVNRKSVR